MNELWRLPNLLSLSRIAMTPVIGYFLWLDTPQATAVCVALLFVAGITDGLDGLLARRMGMTSEIGKALDPIADKFLAAALIVLLIFFREFPLWLAALILGRDLLILVAGLLLLQGRRIVIGSNITGKYTFTAIALLLGSYIIRFDFGVRLLIPITVALLILSTVLYARVFQRVRDNRPPVEFADRPLYRVLRIGSLMIGILILGWQLAERYL